MSHQFFHHQSHRFCNRIAILTLNVKISKNILIIIFQLNEFLKSGHKYIKNLIKNEIAQTIQAFVTTQFRFIELRTQASIKTTRNSFAKSSKFSSTWVIDKSYFVNLINKFKIFTKPYKKIEQYRNFDLRDTIVSDSSEFELSFSFDISNKKRKKESSTPKKLAD